MVNSIRDREIENLPAVKTIADGIAVKTPGEHTYELCQQYVDEIVTVSDDEVATAILALMEQQKLVAEGAGAVSVAAAMFNKVDVKGKNVVCLVSGGNIDVTILSRVISRGLLSTGLETISRIIADLGGNIVSIHHDRYDLNIDITSCILDIRVETRDQAHIDEIVSALLANGIRITNL